MHIQTGTGNVARSGLTRAAAGTAATWTGRTIGTLVVALLSIDAVAKLLQVQPVIEETARLGYRPGAVAGLGITLAACVLLYIAPRTSILGAVLLTGYLGGAIATHVRVGSPVLTHVLFPVYLAVFLWGSLLLRDARLRAFLPWGIGGER